MPEFFFQFIGVHAIRMPTTIFEPLFFSFSYPKIVNRKSSTENEVGRETADFQTKIRTIWKKRFKLFTTLPSVQ